MTPGARAEVWQGGEWQPSTPLLTAAICLGLVSYVALGVVVVSPYVTRLDSDFLNYFKAAKALTDGRSPFSAPGFDYPPALALVVVPLVPLGMQAARWVWFVLSHACLLGAAALLWRRLGGDRVALLAVALVWGLGGTIAENLALGQVNPLLLLLVVVSLGTGSSPVGRSLAIGGASALKLWPGILITRDAILGSPRRSLQALLVTLGFVLIPLLTIAAVWPSPSTPPHATYWMGTPALKNFSFPATALRVLDPPRSGRPLPAAWIKGNDPAWLVLRPGNQVVSIGVATVGLAVGLAAVVAVVRRRGADRIDPLRLTGALLALVLAWAPLCWYHYRLLHFVGAAAVCAAAFRTRRWALAGLALSCLVVATWAAFAIDRLYLVPHGWTAASPVALWLLTSVVPVSDLALGWTCLVDKPAGNVGATRAVADARTPA